jgi:hypothetical protein
MTLCSQYINSLMVHTINNTHLYIHNSEIHSHETRYKNDLHLPITNSKKYIEGPYFSAIKIYNHLPEYIKSQKTDLINFKKSLKSFLCQHPFYSMQEYFNSKEDF